MSRRSLWFALLRNRHEERPTPDPPSSLTPAFASVPALLRGRWRLDDDDLIRPHGQGRHGACPELAPAESTHFRAALSKSGPTIEVTE